MIPSRNDPSMTPAATAGSRPSIAISGTSKVIERVIGGRCRIQRTARNPAAMTSSVTATPATLATSGHEELVPQNRMVPTISQPAISGAARASSCASLP